MADPFVAEIRIFPFNFPPRGWAWCDGQLLPIQQNTALFSLLGTTYGGNGYTVFALPDLQGRTPVGFGEGPVLSPRHLGETGGSETVTLLESEMPAHTHFMRASTDQGKHHLPGGGTLADTSERPAYHNTPDTNLAPETLAPAGGDQPHNNMMPYLTFYFCIAMQGVYPPRP